MEKIKHVWSVLCGGVSVDKTTNNISLFNSLEQVNLPAEFFDFAVNEGEAKSVPIKFYLVDTWARGDDGEAGEEIRFAVKIEGIDPFGKRLGGVDYKGVFAPGVMRFRNVAESDSINIGGVGVHKFIVSVKTSETDGYVVVAEIPLDIKIANRPQIYEQR